jgi:mercuric ion binding protein
MKKYLFALATVAAFASPVAAATRTATLTVNGMTCAACPLTVKQALKKVDGVIKAEVSFEKKQAIVTFDDKKTSVDALTQATANVGFPSSAKQ